MKILCFLLIPSSTLGLYAPNGLKLRFKTIANSKTAITNPFKRLSKLTKTAFSDLLSFSVLLKPSHYKTLKVNGLLKSIAKTRDVVINCSFQILPGYAV